MPSRQDLFGGHIGGGERAFHFADQLGEFGQRYAVISERSHGALFQIVVVHEDAPLLLAASPLVFQLAVARKTGLPPVGP